MPSPSSRARNARRLPSQLRQPEAPPPTGPLLAARLAAAKAAFVRMGTTAKAGAQAPADVGADERPAAAGDEAPMEQQPEMRAPMAGP